MSEQNQLDICIIGAGISGICAGVKLKTSLGIKNFTIFEENHEVGGTWLESTYPKCSSDTPTHFYSYSFEQNPEWSANYCSQQEVLEYFKGVAKKHDLYSNLKFNHQLRRMEWDEKLCKWKIAVLDKETEILHDLVFDIVIAGPGLLRIPIIPEKFQKFKGPLMHSSQWDSNVQLEGKNVAVIGSGTSAVQIVPGIVDQVKTLYSFQRHPGWVVPKPQFQYPKLIQTAFKKIPGLQYCWRSCIFWTQEAFFSGFKKDTVFNSLGKWLGTTYMNRQLKDRPELHGILLPNYAFGSKRVGLSNEYYPALARPNVKVIRGSISEVKNHSVIAEDGNEYEIDVLILATGYDVTDYLSTVEVTGCGSKNILDLWKSERPEAYLGVINHDAPNLFLVFGPNTGFLYTSNVFPIECQVNWIMEVMQKMISNGAGAVRATKSAQEEYMKKLHTKLEETVYGAYDCEAWRGNEKQILGYHSTSLASYWKMTRKVKWSKLEFIYK